MCYPNLKCLDEISCLDVELRLKSCIKNLQKLYIHCTYNIIFTYFNKKVKNKK